MATSKKDGNLERSNGDDFRLHLAEWLPPEDRYQRRYRPVTPASRLITGSDDQVAPDETIAEWHITDWSKGSGKPLWEDGFYNWGNGLHPNAAGHLEAGWKVDHVGVNANADGEVMKLGGETIYTAGNTELNEWVFSNDNNWDTVGSLSWTDPTGLAIADNLDELYVAHGTVVDKVTVSTATNNASFATGLTQPVNLAGWRGRLFALQGYKLTEIDTGTGALTDRAGTGTVAPNYDSVVGTAGSLRNRLAISDVGLWWTEDLGQGVIVVREYNVPNDSEAVIATIDIPHGYVQSVAYASGIYMAVVIAANQSSAVGRQTYLWIRSQGVSSIVGPLPSTFSGIRATTHAVGIVAGKLGAEVLIYYDSALLSYNLATGGVNTVAVDFVGNISDTTVRGAVIYGQHIFIAGNDAQKVVRVDPRFADTTSTHELHTGRYDFGYRGVDKLFADVTIQLAKSLQASGTGDTIQLEYSVDGGTFTSVGAAMDSTDGRTKRWALTNVVGKTLEWKILMDVGNVLTQTPEILSLTTRGMGAEYRPEWVLQLDLTHRNSARTISNLKSLALRHEVLTFHDPWQVNVRDAPEQFQVTIEDVFTPAEQDDGALTATIRLRATETV